MRSTPLVAVALVGCAPTASLELPAAAPEGARIVWLLHEGERDDPASVSGVMLPVEGAAVEPPERPYVGALYFGEPRLAIGWPLVGRVEHDPDSGSRIPRPLGAYALVDGAWVDAPELIDEPRLRRLRLRTEPGAICASGRACFRDEPDELFDVGLWCGPSCAPSAEFASPTPPARPDFGSDCAAGFVPKSAGDGELSPPLRWCEGVVEQGRDEALSCPERTRLALGPSCVPVGRRCTLVDETWPEAPVGASIWVSATALAGEGDGSRTRPWPLETAVAAARTGDVVVLSTGVHRATVASLAGGRLYGACTASTTITFDELTVAGSASIDGLSLRMTSLQLRHGASFVVEGAELAGRVDVSEGARLEAHDAVLWTFPPEPVAARVAGQLTVTDVEHRFFHVVVTGASARADLTGVIAVNGPAPVLTASAGAQLSIEGSVLGGRREAGPDGIVSGVVNVVATTASIERSTFAHAYVGIRATRGAVARGDQLVFHHLTSGIEVGSVRGEPEEAARFLGEDLVFRDVASGAQARPHSRIELERIGVVRLDSSPLNVALYSTPGAASFAAHDVTAIRGNMVFLSQGQSAELRRLEAHESRVGAQIEAPSEGGGGGFVISDVLVKRSLESAIALRGTVNGPPPLIRVERVDSDGSGGTGLLIRAGGLRAKVEDFKALDVHEHEGEWSEVSACRTYPNACRGVGIVARVGDRPPGAASVETVLELSRFELGAELLGVDLEGDVKVTARHGRVSAGGSGLSYPSATYQWVDRFAEVEWLAPTPVVGAPEALTPR